MLVKEALSVINIVAQLSAHNSYEFIEPVWMRTSGVAREIRTGFSSHPHREMLHLPFKGALISRPRLQTNLTVMQQCDD
jgi:hypothetical protein